MQDRIEEILKGNFDYQIGALDFSCSKLELSLEKGIVYTDSFEVYAQTNTYTTAYIYSSNFRLKLKTDSFIGPTAQIEYSFDSTGMTEGETIRGEISVISECGEYYLPFAVSIIHKTVDSSLGSIKNLFHFTNLAKSDWNEALRLFYSPEFSSVFLGNDRQYLQLYKGLAGQVGNSRNMEEFILGVNKKQRIEYIVEDHEIKIENPAQSTEYGLNITRNGWGYTFLEVSCENNLISFEQTSFNEGHFNENKLSIWFTVDVRRLHNGNNYDRIIIRNGQSQISIPVTIVEGNNRIGRSKELEIKRLTVHLMSYYQAFRLKKISMSTWLKETEKIVDDMISADETSVNARLFQAQVLISAERDNEARWILDQAQNMLSTGSKGYAVSYAYLLYLTTLLNRDLTFTRDATETVSRLYAETGDWRIAWLLMYLSEDFSRSDAKKWMLLEDQFKHGCTSPVIYIEALRLIFANPTLLRNLNPFELQICNYAVKNDCLTKEMVNQLVSLAVRQKDFSGILYRILTAAYEKKADEDLLNAICTMLIRASKTGKQYFVWYERGVEADLHLTRLNDYYMMSLDLDRKIPINRMVLMYFAYDSSMDYLRNAYLYADVLNHRDKYPEVYNQYVPQIEKFVETQIKKGRINKNLALLYKNFFNEKMVNEETIHALSTLLFMNQIKTDSEMMVRVIVRHPMLKNESAYPIVDGSATFPLWSREYVILFEDIAGNRYATGVNYTIEKLMIPGKIISIIGSRGKNELGLNLYLCDFDKESIQVGEENRERIEMLSKDERLLEDYKLEMSRTLARFYYEHDITDALDWFLSDVDPDDYSPQARDEFIKWMIIRGMTDKAYDWVCRYGLQNVEVKNIVKLLNNRIEQIGDERDEQVLSLCMYVFKKEKYDELILGYLLRNYEGLTKELRNLWKAAVSFGMDSYYIAEKIIMQMLYTGSYVGEKMEIFKDYVDGGAKSEIELAFISQCAYDYFVNDRLMDAYAFEDMQRIIERGEKLHKVCKLALVKYYSEHPDDLTKEKKKIVKDFISELLLDGVRLNCFSEFRDLLPIPAKLDDSAIIEYHATSGAKAVIHYILEKGNEDDNEYREEDMDAVYGGVYHKEIPLFFGESVQYYITEIINGKSQLTESAAIQKNDIDKTPQGTRYDLVNDIAIAQTLQDYDTIDDMMKDYKRTEYLFNKLFTLR